MLKLGKKPLMAVIGASTVAIGGGAAWAFFGVGGTGDATGNSQIAAPEVTLSAVVSSITAINTPADVLVSGVATGKGAKIGTVTIAIDSTDSFWADHDGTLPEGADPETTQGEAVCLPEWFGLAAVDSTPTAGGSATLPGTRIGTSITPIGTVQITLVDSETAVQNGCLSLTGIPLSLTAVAATA